MNRSAPESKSFLKELLIMFAGCCAILMVSGFFRGNVFQSGDIALLWGLIGFTVAWFWRNEMAKRKEKQAKLVLREVDPQATRPWKDSWRDAKDKGF